MTKLIVFQMDPLETLNLKTDTTLKIAWEAQKRRCRLFFYTPEALSFYNNRLYGKGSFFELNAQGIPFVPGELEDLPLDEADIILVRQNPPVNSLYWTNTYLLELLQSSTRVINCPMGLRTVSEKLFTLRFSDLIPETLITSDSYEVLKFLNFHQRVVIKPLYDYGGRGVLLLHHHDPNVQPLLELYKEHYQEPLMIQRYIPQVEQGDKRIIMLQGQCVGSYLRQPASQQIRSNLRVGGKALPVVLNKDDEKICQTLAPFLEKQGIYLAGLDVIGPYLTEVNVTSPTGFVTLHELYDIDVAKHFWDGLGI